MQNKQTFINQTIAIVIILFSYTVCLQSAPAEFSTLNSKSYNDFTAMEKQTSVFLPPANRPTIKTTPLPKIQQPKPYILELLAAPTMTTVKTKTSATTIQKNETKEQTNAKRNANREQAKEQKNEAKEQAASQRNEAREQAKEQRDEARDQAASQRDDAREQAQEQRDEARDQAASQRDDAREQAQEQRDEARDQAESNKDEARDHAARGNF